MTTLRVYPGMNIGTEYGCITINGKHFDDYDVTVKDYDENGNCTASYDTTYTAYEIMNAKHEECGQAYDKVEWEGDDNMKYPINENKEKIIEKLTACFRDVLNSRGDLFIKVYMDHDGNLTTTEDTDSTWEPEDKDLIEIANIDCPRPFKPLDFVDDYTSIPEDEDGKAALEEQIIDSMVDEYKFDVIPVILDDLMLKYE